MSLSIVAVDPGKVSGYASFFRPDFYSTEFEDRLELLDRVVRTDLIVCESFTPRPGVRTWQPDALEIIGALRYIADRNGIPFELQSPAAAKRFSTNRKLEAMGWRNPSPGGHADDAARHLLLAAVRHGQIDPGRFLK